jgi:hypothetical protein
VLVLVEGVEPQAATRGSSILSITVSQTKGFLGMTPVSFAHESTYSMHMLIISYSERELVVVDDIV